MPLERDAHSPQPWSQRPLRERVRWCAAWRRLVATHGDDLAACMHDELAKPQDEAWLGDVATLLTALRWLERNAHRVLRARRLRGTPWFLLGQRHWVERAPLGRVGVIATWNYPVQLLGIQIAQALVAGNTVVVKPSERSPRTQALLLDLAERALGEVDAPPGTIERQPATREAGERMLRVDAFDHVVFTGSTDVGRSIAARLGPTLTPSTLELSGRDSAIVLEDADIDLAARCVWEAVRINAGQTCMAPRRVLVVGHATAERLQAALAERARAGSPRPLTSECEAERIRALARDAARTDAEVVPPPADDETGAIVRPRVLFNVPPDDPATLGDHFGPLLAVVRCDDEAEALRIHRSIDQHLAASVFTRDTARARRLTARLSASHLTINDALVPTAHPAASLGGRSQSGWGDSRGTAGLLAMTREVHVSITGRFRIPEGGPDDKRLNQLIAFIKWRYGARTTRPSRTPRNDAPNTRPHPAATRAAEALPR